MSSVIAEKFYTVAEACEILDLTRQRVCQLIKSGQLRAEKAHNMLYIIPAKALDEFQKLDRPAGLNIEYRQPVRQRRKGA
jgi:excisionase family DNA binding protein